MKANIGTIVKILQKDAPYNAYGKTGSVVDIDQEAGETWFQVQFDKTNQQRPYETWVRERDLKQIEKRKRK